MKALFRWCVLASAAVLVSTGLMVSAKVGPAAAAPDVPSLSGQWLFPASPGSPTWTLESSADGSTLRAAWTGGPGHYGLRGSFIGGLTTLAGGSQAYSGTMRVIEGDLDVTGTMTMQIVNGNRLLMSYQQSNGPSAHNAVMTQQNPMDQGWTFQLNFGMANGLAGHGEGSNCVASEACMPIPPAKQASFSENACTATCTYRGPFVDLVSTSSHLTVAPLSAPKGFITNANMPQTRTLTIGVRVYNSSNDNACPDGDTGVATVVDRDMINQARNVHSDKFSLGGWTRPCAGQTFSIDAISPAGRGPGATIGAGQFLVVVSIACYDVEAWSTAACEDT